MPPDMCWTRWRARNHCNPNIVHLEQLALEEKLAATSGKLCFYTCCCSKMINHGHWEKLSMSLSFATVNFDRENSRKCNDTSISYSRNTINGSVCIY